MIVDILDWDLTYTELIEWVSDNNVDLDAINGYGGRGPSTKYVFRREEDFVAFKLKFAKENYKGTDTAFYYAPYKPSWMT
jgi:hypothetical protein